MSIKSNNGYCSASPFNNKYIVAAEPTIAATTYESARGIPFSLLLAALVVNLVFIDLVTLMRVHITRAN